jgi:hypothetical protein
MLMLTLSQGAIRGLMIGALGLGNDPQPPATKESIRATIRKINMLQIDSINVVARAPYFVLWSRLGDYDPDWLDELVSDVALFEHYASANCYLPIEDFPLFLVGSRIFDWRDPNKWLHENSLVAEVVLDHVRTHGETRHTDFRRNDGQKTTWDNPKLEQIALDYLCYVGELMVSKRDNFQRVYDLRERVYPDSFTLPHVSRADAHDQFVLDTIKALGVTKSEWIANYYRLKHNDVKAALKRLENEDQLMRVAVQGWKKPAYVHPDNFSLVEAAAAGDIPRSKTTLLSPFDPLVWDNRRLLDLFGFDYKIEFYFPAEKRKYGYFSLPILYNNMLIGRLDPKAHLKEGIFEVKSFHLERDVILDDALVGEVKRVLKACAVWHQTPRVIVREANVEGLAERLSD